MDKRQENLLSMYYAVQKATQEYSSTWTGLSAFVSAASEFNNKIDRIRLVIDTQILNLRGVHLAKVNTGKEMARLASQVAAALFAYAIDQGDTRLKEQARITKPMGKARDAVKVEISRNVFTQAQLIGTAALSGYGVDAAVLNALDNAINVFAGMVSEPRKTVSLRKGATTELKQLFKEVNALLKEKLDKLAEQFKATEPAFYRVYRNTRKLVNAGLRHKGEEVPPTP